MPTLYNNIPSWENPINSQTIELRRKVVTYGQYGAETVSESKIADIVVSIQPIVETDLMYIPEGDRKKIAFKIYTSYSGLKEEDIVKRGFDRYQIKTPPQYWPNGIGLHHYKAFLYKIEN